MNFLTVVCIASLLAAGAAPSALAARGDLLTTYDFYGSGYCLDAERHHLYVSDGTKNVVKIIDTRSLAVVGSISTGSRTAPTGMTLSRDGSQLYVSYSGSAQIGVIDTQTMAWQRTMNIPYFSSQLATGLDGRLYATSASYSILYGMMQIDSNTGQYLGTINLGLSYYDGGVIKISPDGHSLYYGQRGTSPSQLAKLDVSTPEPAVLWKSVHSTYTNGSGLVLSHSGEHVYFLTAGTGMVDKRRTSDMEIDGTFMTGSGVRAMALSPDDKIAYIWRTKDYLELYDTATCTSFGRMKALQDATNLIVDESGTRLFGSFYDGSSSGYQVRVYDTGFPPVPEPAGLAVMAAGCVALAGSLIRKRRT